MKRSRRLAVLGIIVALSSFTQIVLLAHDVQRYWLPGWEDEVTRAERTFAPLRARLAGQHYVGYATVVPNDSLRTLEHAKETWHHFLAQFALAPTVVSRRPGVSPVVANFPTAAALDAYLMHGDRVLWREGGLALLEGPSR